MRHFPSPLPVLLVAVLLLGFVAAPALAQMPDLVYPRPPAESIVVERDLPFAPSLTLDVYRPAGDATVPVVIFVNGVGSPTLKDWAGYRGWGEVTAAAGLGAVLYQSASGHEAENLDQVIAWLGDHATRLRLDPQRLVLWSSSANVRTGLIAAMEPGREAVRGAVVYYGNAEPESFRHDVPVLLVRSGLDSTELNGWIDALVGRALAANAPWTVANHASGVHGFDVFDDDDRSRELIARTLEFMQRVTTPDAIAAQRAGAAAAALGGAFARGDWVAAVEGYRRRTAADPEDGESHRRLGLALLALDQPAAALEALETAHRLGRGGVRDTVVPVVEAAARAGRVDRAIHWLDIALSTSFGPPLDEVRTAERFASLRDTPELRELLAGVEAERRVAGWIDEGRIDEAVAALVAAEDGRLVREPVQIALAYRLLAGGHPDAAVRVFRLATERHPDSANAWESLGEALEAAGHHPESIAACRKALDRLAADSRLSAAGREQIRLAASQRIERLEKTAGP